MSWRRFHHVAASSGMRTMGKCSTPKPTPPPRVPVVIIDEDDEGGSPSPDSEVFIINDAAEIARAAAACNTKKGNSFCSNVINIDDDEEEEGGGDRTGPSTAGAGSPPVTKPHGRGLPRNRYGLDYFSDSDKSELSEGYSSDDDGSSDCEILDDTSGTARKLWEDAALRKGTPHDPPECKNRTSASTSSAESSTQHVEDVENLFAAECHLDDNIWEHSNQDGPCRTSGPKYGDVPSSVPNAHGSSMDNVSNGKEAAGCNDTTSLDPDTACNDKATHFPMGPIHEKAPEASQPPDLDETFKPQRYTSYSFVSANRVFPACFSTDREHDSPPPVSASTPEQVNEKIPEGTYSGKVGLNAHDKITERKKDMCFAADDGSDIDQLKEDTVSISRDSCLRQSAEYLNKNASANVMFENCSCPQKNLANDSEKLGQSAVVQDAPGIQDGIIGAREKHKESVEYKRAAEEEWASRMRQLAIQAEEAKEAKKLRKRKKAEALRLVDMEKRQKQRLEEVRESQRKNEEVIQLKEQYRGTVRLDLENMGRRYTDMASILRALGIPVEGIEVKAAYKQALLKFHPDRVSRNDIYQQVKAEETFKFISRLKEKLKL